MAALREHSACSVILLGLVQNSHAIHVLPTDPRPPADRIISIIWLFVPNTPREP